MHAQRQRIALGVFAVGPDHRWREAMAFIESGRAGGDVGVRAQSHAFEVITILEPGQTAEQRVFQDGHEITFEEDTGRLAAGIFHDLDVVWRGRLARYPRALER